jgi:hypothetical protein
MTNSNSKLQDDFIAAFNEESKGKDNLLTIYFFKPTSWYGQFIRVLQFLIGAPWNAPTHVAIGYKGKLIQLLADEVDIRPDSGAAYREAEEVVSVYLDEEQSLNLVALVTAAATLDSYFSVTEAVWFVWQMITRKGTKVYSPDLDFGDVGTVKSSKAVFFCPPLTCTSFVWYALDELPVDWRILSASHLQQALDTYIGELE